MIPATAAVLLRQRAAQQTDFSHASNEIGWHGALLVHFSRQRRDLLLCEVAGKLLNF